jgi:putative transposase
MRIDDPKSGRPYFSKRRRRFDEDRQPRELTFSCYRGYPFLSRDRTREWFREALEAARSHIGIELWAYVTMPEHIHLVVLPDGSPGQISRFLKAIKEPVARKAVDHLHIAAPQ